MRGGAKPPAQVTRPSEQGHGLQTVRDGPPATLPQAPLASDTQAWFRGPLEGNEAGPGRAPLCLCVHATTGVVCTPVGYTA